MDFIEEYIRPHFNFWIYVILMMIGLYAMITKNNLIKKLIGMSIFQTAIILFYVSLGVKGPEAKIPILPHHHHHEEGAAGHGEGNGKADAGHSGNPAPRDATAAVAEAVADSAEVHGKADDPAHPAPKETTAVVASAVAESAGKGEAGAPGGTRDAHEEHTGHEINPDNFANPLPHVLMLTAIVVGVSTLGVALAVTQVIYKAFGTIEEDEILAQIKTGDHG